MTEFNYLIDNVFEVTVILKWIF